MALNPGIILQGQTPDLMGVIDRSNSAAFNQRQNQHTNALQSYVQENGAGIMQGDQNALAGYAAFDPQAAFNMRGANEDRQRGIEAAATAAREHAAQISAAEAAAEAEQYNKAIAIMSGIQSPEQWDAAAQQFGLPDLAGQFDNRETIMLATRDTADIYAHYAGAEDPTAIQTLRIRAQEAGLQPGSPEYQAFMANGGKPNSNGITITNPDGTVTQIGGSGQQELPDLTVDAAKNAGFLIRARESIATLDRLEAEGTSITGKGLQSVPFGLGNFAQTEDYQLFDQARRDFVNAILRRESGAVISEQEFENANQQYFPVPGDTAAVIAQKNRNRQTAIAGLEVGSGEGINHPTVVGNQPQENPPPSTQTGSSPEDIVSQAINGQSSTPLPQSFVDSGTAQKYGLTVEELWDNMTPEDQALWAN